jgi:hypothetical protein
MKKRLENAEKVKESGPKLASPEFKLGDRVVVQHPVTKVWDTHGRITRKYNKRRYLIQADAGHTLFRNRKFIRLSAAHEPPTASSPPNPPSTSPKPAPQTRRERSKRTRKKPSRYLD